jgi:hypothetical protein
MTQSQAEETEAEVAEVEMERKTRWTMWTFPSLFVRVRVCSVDVDLRLCWCEFESGNEWPGADDWGSTVATE